MSVSVFNRKTHANENASQLFSICFQRQILKADHAKRSHAHREETLSVVVKIPTIPMANPLPRYSHLAPQYSLVFVFAASFYFSLFLSVPVSWWQFSIPNLTLVFTALCCDCSRPCGDSRESHSPPPLLERGPHILLTHREVR